MYNITIKKPKDDDIFIDKLLSTYLLYKLIRIKRKIIIKEIIGINFLFFFYFRSCSKLSMDVFLARSVPIARATRVIVLYRIF